MNEIIKYGLTFIDGDLETGTKKHTYTDFGMIMTSHNIPKPEPMTQKVVIPYQSGSIDLTDITGETSYNDRTGLKFEFQLKDNGRANTESLITQIAQFIHGKKLIMISDAEDKFYYFVRLEISFAKMSTNWTKVTLSGTAEPYKYLVAASGENWEWDPFDFENDVITTSDNITINGQTSVPVEASVIYSVPEIIVKSISSTITLTFKGKTYSMPSTGSYYFPQVRINSDTTNLAFNGSGVIELKYRGRFI